MEEIEIYNKNNYKTSISYAFVLFIRFFLCRCYNLYTHVTFVPLLVSPVILYKIFKL